MIKSIIFDFDGVIHDTLEIGYKINKLIFPELTLEEYKRMFMGNLYENKRINSESSNKFFELQAEYYKGLKIEDEIKEEIKKLKENYHLFIITSNKESTVKKYFQENRITDLFEDIMGIETHKSKIEKFKILFQKHKLNIGECIFVTDTLGDILEANRAGIKTIAVDFGFHDRITLQKGNPCSILSNFSDISEVVKNLS